MIANHIFSHDPQPIGSIQLVATYTEMDTEFIYEVLLTILMEGFKLMVESIEEVSVENCSADHIILLGQWIQSLGFDLIVEECAGTTNNYYCKVLLNNQQNTAFFYHKKITDKQYHFILNSTQTNDDHFDINEIVTIIPFPDRYIKIQFHFIDTDDKQ